MATTGIGPIAAAVALIALWSRGYRERAARGEAAAISPAMRSRSRRSAPTSPNQCDCATSPSHGVFVRCAKHVDQSRRRCSTDCRRHVRWSAKRCPPARSAAAPRAPSRVAGRPRAVRPSAASSPSASKCRAPSGGSVCTGRLLELLRCLQRRGVRAGVHADRHPDADHHADADGDLDAEPSRRRSRRRRPSRRSARRRRAVAADGAGAVHHSAWGAPSAAAPALGQSRRRRRRSPVRSRTRSGRDHRRPRGGLSVHRLPPRTAPARRCRVEARRRQPQSPAAAASRRGQRRQRAARLHQGRRPGPQLRQRRAGLRRQRHLRVRRRLQRHRRRLRADTPTATSARRCRSTAAGLPTCIVNAFLTDMCGNIQLLPPTGDPGRRAREPRSTSPAMRTRRVRAARAGCATAATTSACRARRSARRRRRSTARRSEHVPGLAARRAAGADHRRVVHDLDRRLLLPRSDACRARSASLACAASPRPAWRRAAVSTRFR